MGLGDAVIGGLTKILSDIPQIDSLLLSDNRLTDDSLCDLCAEVTRLHNLTHLDISFNDMDDSPKIILEYLLGNSDADASVRVWRVSKTRVKSHAVGSLAHAFGHAFCI